MRQWLERSPSTHGALVRILDSELFNLGLAPRVFPIPPVFFPLESNGRFPLGEKFWFEIFVNLIYPEKKIPSRRKPSI